MSPVPALVQAKRHACSAGRLSSVPSSDSVPAIDGVASRTCRHQSRWPELPSHGRAGLHELARALFDRPNAQAAQR